MDHLIINMPIAELMETDILYQEGEWLVHESKSTRETILPLPTWKHSLEKPEYFKVVRLFINDLHNAEYVGDNFIFKQMPFLFVYFTGTVVSRSTYNENIVCLEVHDGANSITCMIEESFLNKIEHQRIKLGRNSNPVEGDKNSATFQAALMTYRATSYLAKHVPRKRDIHPGDIVHINGKLRENNGKKYVFVNKINTGTVADHGGNIEYVLNIRYLNKN